MDTHPQAGSPVKNELSKNRYPLRRSTTSSRVRGRTPKYHELPCCSGKLLVFAIDKPSHTQKCTTANCQRSEHKTPKGELQVLGNIGEHSLHHLILGFFGNTQKDRTEISYSTHSKLLSCVFSIVLFTIPYYTQIFNSYPPGLTLWTSDVNAEEISTKLGPHQLLLSENLWESNPNPMVHHHVHYTNMARGWDMFITRCQTHHPWMSPKATLGSQEKVTCHVCQSRWHP